MPFYPPYQDRDGDPSEAAEQAQQEADHLRDVEQDRQMVTDDPEPHCSCNSAAQDPNCHIDHSLSAIEASIAFGQGRPSTEGLGLPHYSKEEYGIGGILNYSYWNCNGAVAIVAIEGAVADWAAYVGGPSPLVRSEEATVRWVCRMGAKLSRQQAHRWFPDLPIEAYRE